jgi:hypothetical protein
MDAPIILSPNLGCPEIINLQAINGVGLRIVVAAPTTDAAKVQAFTLDAYPSFEHEGTHFRLQLAGAQELRDEALPPWFKHVDETRLLVSTLLRTRILPAYSFWTAWAKPTTEIDEKHLRVVRETRSTLYDLYLPIPGCETRRVRHALCLRESKPCVKFVHLTDLHVAARNDVWATEVRSSIVGSDIPADEQHFENFNQRLRKFIKWANEQADEGELDFVWAPGDIVDFCRTGLFDRTPGDTNWPALVEILTGCGAEKDRENEGLRVPMFTTTGNHDWRTFPYDPATVTRIFGITKKCAKELDFWYRNTSEEVGKKLDEVSQKLMSEGSPLLARSWWGAIAGMGLRGFLVGGTRLLQRSRAYLVNYGRQTIWAALGVASVGAAFKLGLRALWSNLECWITQHPWPAAGLIAGLILLTVASFTLSPVLCAWLRGLLEDLIAIEASTIGMSEYFLQFNPYFNYAFQLENCHFITLDTGPDCLTAQSFWDQGAKKVRRITIKDNILGGSPDTMGFYSSNEYYPYGQIPWLERVLSCIASPPKKKAANGRVFVGLHAPPANLSHRQRVQAEQQLRQDKTAVLMKKEEGPLDGFDIRYGTVNHYVSQLFYLCLGHRESEMNKPFGPGVDAVFAGHAHWNMEFKLRKPDDAESAWSPQLFYGRFSHQVEAESNGLNHRWGPLLLQTAACGPAGAVAEEVPPNFRYVTVEGNGAVCHLRPCNFEHLPQIGKRARPESR